MHASFRSDLLVAATTALLSAVALFLIWEGLATGERDRATGEMLAELAASASLDGLIVQDRIELGVVANRLTGVPRVSGVAIFTVDNELLALSGTLEEGTPFVHPIVLDDMVLGFARIVLLPPGRAPYLARLGLSAVVLSIVALLIAWWSYRMRRGASGPAAGPAADPIFATDPISAIDPISTTEPAFATEAATLYLLVGNLDNQLSLSRSERRRAVSQALTAAQRVAEIYRCRSKYLPGTGLVMTFSTQAGHPAAFEAVCAAFLFAEILARDAPSGDYRFGLHVLELQAGDSPADYPDVLEDAALLAAIGASGAIAASEAFFAGLGKPEGLKTEAFSHPMLEELHTSARTCRLVTDLDENYRLLIDSQADRLSAAAVNRA